MNIDALPKFLFLHEQSQEMQDQRIRSNVQYDMSRQNAIKVIRKKINNTIQFSEKLSQNNQINCLAYSNKLGLLVTCLEEEILITDLTKLQSLLLSPQNTQKQLKKLSSSLKFSGKIYLSPDQTKFLAVNKKQFLLFDLKNLKKLSSGANQYSLRHFIFINDSSFAGWNFLQKAYIYKNISQKIGCSQQLPNIEHCTSINLIKKSVIVCEKENEGDDNEQDTKVIVFDETCSKTLNEISLKNYENKNNYFFNFTKIISFFSINNQQPEQFSGDDIYGLVLGYYDDYQDEPDRRYLNFLKGNLIQKDQNIQIRGFQLFQSPNQDRSFYYDQNSNKKPFQVQLLTTDKMKIIMIQNLQVVYVVDSSLPFEKLNFYTLNPLHEIKLEGGKFFKGICLMKNMLKKQKIPPAQGSNETCDMICKQFQGQFLSLYFPAKQTELTVPFPATLLVLGDNKIQRRYAASTVEGVQQYEVDKIKQGISKIKKSPYIQSVQTPIKISQGKQISLQSPQEGLNQRLIPSKKEDIVVKNQQKKAQKQISTNLFSSNAQIKKPASSIQNPLFGNISQKNQASNKEKKQETKTNPFDSSSNFSKNEISTNIFASNQNKATSLFGLQNKGPSLTSNQSKGKSIFSIPTSKNESPITLSGNKDSIFGSNSIKTPILQSLAQTKDSLAKLNTNIVPLNQNSEKNKEIKSNMFLSTQNKAPNLFDKKSQVISINSTDKKQSESILGSKSSIFQQCVISFNLNINKGIKATENKPVEAIKTLQKKEQNAYDSLKNIPNNGSIFNNTKTPQVTQIIPDKKPNNPLTSQKKQILGNKQAESKQETPKQTNDIDLNSKKQAKVNEQHQVVLQKKAANIQKLKQLGLIIGHNSVDSIPEPLKLLTDNQVDALINSFKSIKDKEKQEKLARQKQEQQKLFRKESFKKVLNNFQKCKTYIKNLRSLNQDITSLKIFSLQNAKTLVNQTLKLNENKHFQQAKPTRQMANMMKDYAKKMQFLQKQYIKWENQGQQNQNPNKMNQQNQRQLRQNIEEVQAKINFATYYENSFFPEQLSTLKLINNTVDYQQKWTEIVKSKNEKNLKLKYKVDSLLEQLNHEQSKKNSMKSSSVMTIASTKRKGLFSFSIQSSDSSSVQSEKQQSLPIQKIYTNEIQGNNNRSKILIKFKPKTINLLTYTKNITPLLKFEEEQPQLLYKAEKSNPADAFKISSNPLLQSGIKKSINFKDKIPMKKTQDDQKHRLFRRIKYSENQGSEKDSNHSLSSNEDLQSGQQEGVPNMGRSISLVHNPVKSIKQNLLLKQKKQEFNQRKQEQKKQKGKKIMFQDLSNDEKKKQVKVESKGNLLKSVNLSLFGSSTQNQKVEQKKIEQSKVQILKKPEQAKKNQQNKTQTKKQLPKKQQQNKQIPQTKTSLFGSSSLFGATGLKSNTLLTNKSTESKQNKLVGEKQKQNGSKQVPSQTKLESNSLFGNFNSTQNKASSLFGSVVAPTLAEKKQQIKKTDQSKAIVADSKSTSLFGDKKALFGDSKGVPSTNEVKPSTSLFGDSSSAPLFGESNKAPLTGDANKASLFAEPQKSQNTSNGSLFGIKKQQIKLPTNLPTIQQKDGQSQSKVSESLTANKSKPKVQPSNNSLFSGSNTLFGQNAASHQTSTFGAANRFMSTGQSEEAPKNSTGFNPNQANFGGGFNQTAGSGFKSFANFNSNSGAQQNNMFGGNQQPSNQINSNSTFNIPQSTQPNLPQMNLNQNQPQSSLFSQPNNSNMFGGNSGNFNNNQNNQSSNFLSGFSVGSTMPVPQGNSNLMKPRK